jgi:hypothetical protein
MEDRRGGLVGAVRPTEALHRLVGAPTGLQQIVRAAGILRGRRVIGVIGRACTASIREYEDALLAALERIGSD